MLTITHNKPQKTRIIEVFRTSITTDARAWQIRKLLQSQVPGIQVDFDLQDCDHVLRTVSQDDVAVIVISTLHKLGLQCEIME